MPTNGLDLIVLAGKPPRAQTVLSDLAHLLVQRGRTVKVLLPLTEPPDPHALRAGLVMHRGLGRAPSTVAALARSGHELCNPWPTVGQDGDRMAVLEALSAAGIPVPLGARADTWTQVRSLVGGDDVVVKRTRGTGRGEEVTRTVPDEPPFDGPYVVEPWVPNDGIDRKLYVAGGQVFGLLKPSTLSARHGAASVPFVPDAEMRDVALASARATGLHLAGIDVLATTRGPIVVDINPFPGYRGVAGAVEALADHVEAHLRGEHPAP